MMIEIRKAGFVNKGAELMIHAAVEKIREQYPDARFAMAPFPQAPYEQRAKMGFYQKAQLRGHRLRWEMLADFIPSKIRAMYGVVTEKQIHVVLDAAGFAYGDPWGAGSSRELAKSCKRWKRNGTKVILLPQAFGSFALPGIGNAIQTAVDHADLVFARDRISLGHLVAAAGERPHVRLAPDFTNLIQGSLPEGFARGKCRFGIVPNSQMIKKTDKRTGECYLLFLKHCVTHLLDLDQGPFFLIHEGEEDVQLAKTILAALGKEIPIVTESHPLRIKGILGGCEGTIGSRYHGLVSALSQAVPSLAVGWSHKYQMLLEDYGYEEGLLDVQATEAEIRQKIERITNPESKQGIRRTLEIRGAELRRLAQRMWSDVFAVMGSR